jgi:hydroxypyruvate reductase
MRCSADKLRRDALRIWQAGVDAVRADRLVRAHLRVEGRTLAIGHQRLGLDSIERIAVVGAGKAGAAMAAAVEEALGPRLMDQKRLVGWVNVPEDCVRPLRRIHLHGARPPGVNEPTQAGVCGAEEILRIVGSLGPDDLCLCLISGGGSALLPAPVEPVTLEDKLAVTRHLSAAGANILELNTVRKQLSRIKGGGLARACRAGRLVTLVISDVLGDPLDVIASGPTAPDTSTAEAALEILDRFHAAEAGISPRVFEGLRRGKGVRTVFQGIHRQRPTPPENSSDPFSRSENAPEPFVVLGNNATAVDAAGREAERLGYAPAMTSAPQSEGPAEQIGRHLAEMALRMRGGQGPDCLISGGEPVVTLVDASRRGLGGRNQQLVLAALAHLADDGAGGIVLLSGGTDGEDGPTDAAGAVVDPEVLAAAKRHGLDPADFLARNDAYHFFEPLGALIKTGPTQTNVCDLRVVLVDPRGKTGTGRKSAPPVRPLA